MTMTKRPDWEELANENQECRCFLEFAYDNYEQFQEWIKKEVAKEVNK